MSIRVNIAAMTIVAGLVVAASALAAPTKAAPATKSTATTAMVTLGKIDAETTPEMTIVNIRLSTRPSWKEVTFQDHGSFIQIGLPSTLIPESGTFIDGAGPHVKKMAAFQVSATDGAVRMFTGANAAGIAKAMTAEVLEDRVIITIDHSKIGATAAATASPSAPASPGADDVIARTTVNHDSPPPSDVFKNDTPIQIGTNTPNFRARFLAVGLFSGIMLFGLAGFWLLKPFLMRRRKPGVEAAVTMRMLATLPLAAKQKLALIQVGQEHILVAVSPDNINLITTLRQNPVIGNRTFGDMLEEADDSSTGSGRMLEMKSSPVASLSAGSELPAVRQSRPFIPRTSAKIFDDQDMPVAPSAKAMVQNKKKGSRLNVSVGDDGVKNLGVDGMVSKTGAEHAIKDLTRQIRDRLKEIQKS